MAPGNLDPLLHARGLAPAAQQSRRQFMKTRWVLYLSFSAAVMGVIALGITYEAPDRTSTALHWCDEGLGCSDS